MLRRLTVENLLLIERAELELSAGLNVLTGETGAGKTLLATGLGLLLGDRSRSGLVRPGAEEAVVEGVFDLPSDLPSELISLVPEGAGEVVLSRSVSPDGRSRARIGGRTSTISDLRELASWMISFHGQHEHRRLTLAGFQLDLLDSACGPEQAELRRNAQSAHDQVLEARRLLERLSGGLSSGQREVDLIRWELEEIEALSPDPDEAASLRQEREVLRSSERIRIALSRLIASISPEDGESGVRHLLAASAKEFDGFADLGGSIRAIAERLAALTTELDDVGAEARAELDALDVPEERLDQVESRLDSLARLEAKYGGSIESVLEHASECRLRLAEMEDLDGAIEAAEDRLDAARDELARISEKLASARRAEAPALAAKVEAELAGLALEGARFSIELSERDEPGPTGGDRVEFMFAANVGLDPSPLGETASGGEISRVLLALLSVSYSRRLDGGRVLVFDEVDAGIGGRTAVAMAAKLSAVAASNQVLCITHLAPVAARAESHFTIAKREAGGVATTAIERLGGDSLVEEMVRMLGADRSDSAARAHALELLSGVSRSDAA